MYKATMNHLCVWYSRMYPRWKVNASCPGHVATGLNTIERTEPRILHMELSMSASHGGSGWMYRTFSNKEKEIPW